MKIFTFIVQSSAAKFIMTDISDALVRLNNEVKFFDFDLFFFNNKNLPDKEKYIKLGEIIFEINNFKPDIVLAYGLEYFNRLFINFIKDLQVSLYDLLKLPCLNLLFDFGKPFSPIEKSRTEFDIKLFKEMQNIDNLFFCWDKVAVDIMKKNGILKTHFFPMAVNEVKFYRQNIIAELSEKLNSDIIFIGGPTPERISALESISDLNLRVYGYDREVWLTNEKLKQCYSGSIIEQKKLCEIYNSSKICVNVTREHGFASLNMRVYEAMACGNLMITDDKSDARELFVENEEILIFKDNEDLRNKTIHFLKNKNEMIKIAEAGMFRVLKEHTYLKRFKNYFPIMVKFLKNTLLLKKYPN